MGAVEIIAMIAKLINTAVELGPTVVKGVEDATPFAEAIFNSFGKKDMTPEQVQQELNELEAKLDELSDRFNNMIIPPEQE